MASNYPSSLDSNTNISNTRTIGSGDPANDHNAVTTAVFALEAKAGIGTSTAAAAASGTVLTKNSDGTTGWVAPSAGGATTLSGDVTGSGTSSITTTLANSGATAGTYTNSTVTVDAKGRVTAAASGSTPIPRRFTTVTYASSMAPNADTTDVFVTTLTGNATIANPTGSPVSGQKLEMHIKQDTTGSRTITYGSNYVFASSLPSPTLSTAAGSIDILAFVYSSVSSKWRFFGAITGFTQ